MKLTIPERAEAFKAAFPNQPASWPWIAQEGDPHLGEQHDVMYAVWCPGAAYGNENPLHGSYPRGYLKKLMAFFPDIAPRDTLHAFAGLLPAGDYVRLDLKAERNPDVVGNVYDAPQLFPACRFELVAADPPYTPKDADIYGTPMVNRPRAVRALADVVKPGGFMAWLDTQWPMHRKSQWVTVARIMVERSTNHDTRSLHIFRRAA